jgi:hypothetical protein
MWVERCTNVMCETALSLHTPTHSVSFGLRDKGPSIKNNVNDSIIS